MFVGWKGTLTAHSTLTLPDARARRLDSARPTQPIQVVVNNAGITRDTLAMRMKPDMWQSVSCELSTTIPQKVVCAYALGRGFCVALASVAFFRHRLRSKWFILHRFARAWRAPLHSSI